MRAAIDAVLPDGLDLLRAVDAADCLPGSLAEQIQASCWQLELAADPALLRSARAHRCWRPSRRRSSG